MSASKRRRESLADGVDQRSTKRHAVKSTEPQSQDGDFQILAESKKHYEFDWINFIFARAKRATQDFELEVTRSQAGSGSSCKDSDEESLDDSMDPDEDSDAELNENAVARCQALLIRSKREVFHDDMEGPSAETSALAFELFDRYGRLRSEFKDHPIKKGSGIWQDELDHGLILLIEHISVDKPYRRRGLGQRMVAAILEEARSRSEPFVALTKPGFLYRDFEQLKDNLTDEEEHFFVAEELRVATTFWRSMGFRRIGSSYWFGLASTANHPCHSLSASEDFDPLEPPNRIEYPAMGSLLADIAAMEENEAVGKVKQAFRDAPMPPRQTRDAALQSLLSDFEIKEDGECVEKLQQAFEHVSVGDPRWDVRDDDGNTVLHMAGIKVKPKCVKWIMERNTELINTRNAEQDTPLEALQSCLEMIRTRRGSNPLFRIEPVSDRFEGFTNEMLSCLCLLSGQTNPSSIELQRLSFGCTCGQCIDGFLSPRMHLALFCRAEIQYHMMCYDLDMSGRDFVDMNKLGLQHVQHPVRENMKTNKSMREGFVKLHDHFVTCLRNDKAPTATNVLDVYHNTSEWPPHTRHFFERGGTVKDVGTGIFAWAMEKDELAGDGVHLDRFADEIKALPECRNDHEFGFVSGMCGYKRVSQIRYVSLMGVPLDD